jgi:hypothetical protein
MMLKETTNRDSLSVQSETVQFYGQKTMLITEPLIIAVMKITVAINQNYYAVINLLIEDFFVSSMHLHK